MGEIKEKLVTDQSLSQTATCRGSRPSLMQDAGEAGWDGRARQGQDSQSGMGPGKLGLKESPC